MSLKSNQIHQGDCVKHLAKVDAGSIDLVFADPPFNIGYDYDVYDDQQDADDYLGWCRQWIDGVYRVLKPDGTFWLAIGDEYAAELKIESQKAGFHCRSWVIWYYTFGVNCANGFSRSHTHLFHFVKDKKKFTFVRPNPNVRVKSARQMVYADLRANPNGRLPDNTWITRPQDAPESFRPNHDTWFFSRVAGTFKEREGFHGCQMPEQLLARIIRTSSHPYDLVLDPFGGSGTTLCVAKKLKRQWIGFELSEDYVKHITQRLDRISPGDPLDGIEDSIESAPATSKGKKRKQKEFDDATIKQVIDAFLEIADGLSVDELLCDKSLNKSFFKACKSRKLGGSAVVWNRLLLKLRAAGELPEPTRSIDAPSADDLHQFGYASEIAWRLVGDEFGTPGKPLSLEDMFCCPDMADYFDQVAELYCHDQDVSSIEYRRAAFAICQKILTFRDLHANTTEPTESEFQLSPVGVEGLTVQDQLFGPTGKGLFLIDSNGVSLYAGATNHLQGHLNRMLSNPNWKKFEPDVSIIEMDRSDETSSDMESNLAALIRQKRPLLNGHLW
ncbi:MAG: site-specific DNA-methyltransferase [Planctomycetota bacterium]